MVLSLSVPGFSKSTPSPPLRPSAVNQSTTIHEALRNNPFGTVSRSHLIASLPPTQAEQEREEEELNTALERLAHIFPDIKIEVFRELLMRFDGESRLHVCVEQLLRHKEEWVAGRWNVPAGDGDGVGHEDLIVPRDERFRSNEYKLAVKTVLLKEFGVLSKSTVDAVLAEVNFCYLRARPTLRDLSKRTWRAAFNNIFKSKRDKDENPLIVWQRQANGESVPRLKDTGCAELDRELHDILLAPLLQTRMEELEDSDRKLAEQLNDDEAKTAEAYYECECCLADVTFEQISTCSENMHVICYACIRRTIQEAVFGQGWEKSVDVERSTLKCLTPFAQDGCSGNLQPEIVKQAILCDKGGVETYHKFEGRLASDALLKSQLKLVRCPFCSYAEVDTAYHLQAEGINWRFRQGGTISTIVTIILLLDLISLFLIPAIVISIGDASAVRTLFHNALLNLYLKARPKQFKCANPGCQRVSCITCQKPWRDPHLCYEPLLLDLRATVEAARTAAVKRTCPRCGLSFVKSSGCNKLTCVCGYSMCYLCRKGLNPRTRMAERNCQRQRRRENIDPNDGIGGAANDEGFEEPEGYKHFCEHFRLNPGARCTECNKCELYQEEDEEAVARRAGEKAEREWRAQQGTAGVEVSSFQVNRSFSQQNAKSGPRRPPPGNNTDWTLDYWLNEVWQEGRWKIEGQALADWIVALVIVIEDI
ncbi:hypothetical protein BDV25DRAFT_151466 [Aspergillus avenaceus]|uniref:RING-type domain-containing protein n=1 Tax=Aspergillus avenaceus TaxID=36643 RepID=A0A5N6U0P8_ASPAV|nr:hypothetical protein BDV25DRAFT_151466 [Aspergillus avenaceus]